MQIEFLTSKENFLVLYDWVKSNVNDLVTIDCQTMQELDEGELYQAEAGFSKSICFTTKAFAPFIKEYGSNEYYKYGVELAFGYCPEEVYEMEFKGYNLQKAQDGNIPSKLYRDSVYAGEEETKELKNIFNKIVGKVRRNSDYVAGRYHLLKFE